MVREEGPTHGKGKGARSESRAVLKPSPPSHLLARTVAGRGPEHSGPRPAQWAVRPPNLGGQPRPVAGPGCPASERAAVSQSQKQSL
eukprot:11884788-Alexandrium_andersonii.AAC.1